MFGRKTTPRDFAAEYAADAAMVKKANEPTHATAGAPIDQRAAVSAVAVLERPALKGPLASVDTNVMNAAHIIDYRQTCEAIGLDPQDIIVEEFRHFLVGKDIPTFNMREVVSYMDDLVAKDNPTGFGWHWCPVRPKDADIPMVWGRPSQHEPSRYIGMNQRSDDIKVPASDFYQSHHFHNADDWRWRGGMVMMSSGEKQRTPTAAELMEAEIEGKFQRRAEIKAFWNTPSPAYTRTLPLHALKKIAIIEKEFAHRVAFLVTEYTTTPDIVVNPDPFLMAVIPNSAVSHGKGRFIIDVWDEPGFGIELMLK